MPWKTGTMKIDRWC